MLKFENSWRIDSPGPIPDGVVGGFSDLIGRVASPGNRWKMLEHFKAYFASAAGATSSVSSSEGWAKTDLATYMDRAAENAPLFIEAFFDACEALQNSSDLAAPDVARMNRVLAENAAGYEIIPPDLISQNPQVAVAVPEHIPSLDEQAQDLIRRSLGDSENLLSEGRHK